LKKRNLTDLEIEMLFAKYDTDGNRELDEEELAAMMADLEGKKKAMDKEIEEAREQKKRPSSAVGTGSEDWKNLVRRVDRMEHTISLVASKIESVLDGKLVLPPAKGASEGN